MSGNPYEPTPSNDGAKTIVLPAPPSIDDRDSPNALSQDQVRRTYDRYAPVYDQLFGAVIAHGRRRMAAAVRSLAPQRILEVGVGTGLTLASYPATSEVVGIDLSESMLERARRKASKLGLDNVRLQVIDGEATPFEDGSFDCVTVPYVLSTTPDPARLVRELRRVCRRGGHIIILNHFSGSRFWWLLERAAQPLSSKVGFRSDFHFNEHVANHDWKILSVDSVNPFGLSRLVVIENV